MAIDNSTYIKQHDFIKYYPDTVTNGKDDQNVQGFTRDVWYHHYVTSLSFKVNIWAQYYFFGSEHLDIQLWRYSIPQKKWIMVKEEPDLYGGWDAVANGKWGRIYVNYKQAPTDGDFMWNETFNDSIHYDIAIKRFNGVSGDHKSRVHLMLGNYSTMPESQYTNLCKGSPVVKLPSVNTSWHVQGERVLNPFDEPWGNVTFNNGSLITTNDYINLLPKNIIK